MRPWVHWVRFWGSRVCDAHWPMSDRAKFQLAAKVAVIQPCLRLAGFRSYFYEYIFATYREDIALNSAP